MYIKELNDNLAEHQIFVQIVLCNQNSSNPERCRLLKVERNATEHIQITVESEISKNLYRYQLVTESQGRDSLEDIPAWVLVYEDPMTGELTHAARPQLYIVNGLITAHFDD